MTAGKQDVMCLLEWEVGPSVKALACDLETIFLHSHRSPGTSFKFLQAPFSICNMANLNPSLCIISMCSYQRHTHRHWSASYSCSKLFEIFRTDQLHMMTWGSIKPWSSEEYCMIRDYYKNPYQQPTMLGTV